MGSALFRWDWPFDSAPAYGRGSGKAPQGRLSEPGTTRYCAKPARSISDHPSDRPPGRETRLVRSLQGPLRPTVWILTNPLPPCGIHQCIPIVENSLATLVDGISCLVGDVVDGDEMVVLPCSGGVADVGAGEVGVEPEERGFPRVAAIEADATFDAVGFVAAAVGEKDRAVAEVGEVGRVFAGLCDAGEVGPGMASV